MSSFELSERSRRLLETLVCEYIETGEPVSSHVLARDSGLGVSSATIRNLMVQLEEEGYVRQPHTSAGRVPTDRVPSLSEWHADIGVGLATGGLGIYLAKALEEGEPVRLSIRLRRRF